MIVAAKEGACLQRVGSGGSVDGEDRFGVDAPVLFAQFGFVLLADDRQEVGAVEMLDGAAHRPLINLFDQGGVQQAVYVVADLGDVPCLR